jgi:hypothetical protein
MDNNFLRTTEENTKDGIRNKTFTHLKFSLPLPFLPVTSEYQHLVNILLNTSDGYTYI